MNLRCYCCGELIDEWLALVTMAPGDTDRAFVMKPDHVERVSDATSEIVTRVERLRVVVGEGG